MSAHPVAQQIEIWRIERLVEYPRNPRKNDAAVDRMCSSVREFGFKIPCLVRGNGEVIDGHLRLKAARKLGITEIPVILCDEWTPLASRLKHGKRGSRPWKISFWILAEWNPPWRTECKPSIS